MECDKERVGAGVYVDQAKYAEGCFACAGWGLHHEAGRGRPVLQGDCREERAARLLEGRRRGIDHAGIDSSVVDGTDGADWAEYGDRLTPERGPEAVGREVAGA